jgi:HTH-type transcriptional regulator/antitoxin HigA
MAQIKSEAAYRAALKRIDELLKVVNDSTPSDDPNYLELDMISDMVAEYEEIHYPIS